jgi:hypothetical protein
MSCAPHTIKKIMKVCEMMLEHGMSEEDIAALNDVRFDLMAIARRRFNAASGDEMNKQLDTIDIQEVGSKHSHR